MMHRPKNRVRPTLSFSKKRVPRHEYPIGTVAYYGPNADFASKLVASIVKDVHADPDPLRRWFSETDVRFDSTIAGELSAFFKEHGVKSVVPTDRILGCPHEEGIDYPLGGVCPPCPYWACRDRFTGELIS